MERTREDSTAQVKIRKSERLRKQDLKGNKGAEDEKLGTSSSKKRRAEMEDRSSKKEAGKRRVMPKYQGTKRKGVKFNEQEDQERERSMADENEELRRVVKATQEVSERNWEIFEEGMTEVVKAHHRERNLRKQLEEVRKDNHEFRWKEKEARQRQSKEQKQEAFQQKIYKELQGIRQEMHDSRQENKGLKGKQKIIYERNGKQDGGRNERKEHDRWTEVQLPKLRTSIERIWEEIIMTEEISAPLNMGKEPIP